MNLDVIIGLRDPDLEKQKLHLHSLGEHLFYYFRVVCLNCHTPWGLKTIKGQWGGTFKRGEIEECYWYRWGMKNNGARNNNHDGGGEAGSGRVAGMNNSKKDFWKSPIKPSRAEASWKV